jgi:hypothetical protein
VLKIANPKIAIATNTNGITTIFSLYPIWLVGAIVKLTLGRTLNHNDAVTTGL